MELVDFHIIKKKSKNKKIEIKEEEDDDDDEEEEETKKKKGLAAQVTWTVGMRTRYKAWPIMPIKIK